MKPLHDHRADVVWGALAAAFLVAQQVTGKATRDALFLSHHKATSLPPVMMAAALVAVASAVGASRLLASRSPRQVLPALVGLNGALILAEFVLALRAPGLAAVLVYLQVAATGGLLLSAYWSVVNERFDPWTAKQVVGRLTLGASVGGVLGGVVAFAAAGAVPVTTMLVLTAAFNVAALVALVRFGGDAVGAPAGPPAANPSALGALPSIPYLRLLAIVVAVGAGVEAMLDYVLKSRASSGFASGQDMMAFFAAYHTGMGLLALTCQTLLARGALQGLGLAGTVALRPLAVAATAALGFVDLRLWSAVLCRGSYDVLSNSLFRSGYELLYTPLPEREKRAAKQIVDVAFDKVGALCGGALTLAAVRFLEGPERALLLLAGTLSLLSLGLTQRLHRGYVTTLEEALRAGKVRLEPDEVVDSTTRFTMTHLTRARADSREDPVPLESSKTLTRGLAIASTDPLLGRIADLRSGDTARIRRVLRDPDAVEPALVPHLLPLVGRDDVYLDVLRALRRRAPQSTGQILDMLLDGTADPVVRRRLPRVLKASPTPRAVEGLLRGIDDGVFDVRAACADALASIATRISGFRAPEAVVFAAVDRELRGAPTPGQEAGSRAPDDDALLEHVFGLLSLALDPGPLRIAAWAIRGDDPKLKGTALEYLENVLPREIRALFPRFVGAPRASRTRSTDEVLAALMTSGDSVVAARDRLRRRGLRRRG